MTIFARQGPLAILLLALLHAHVAVAERAVAITIDDLPRGGDGGERTPAAVRTLTERLLRPFSEQRVPVMGFVNEGRPVEFAANGLREILDVWLDAGADLGNQVVGREFPQILLIHASELNADAMPDLLAMFRRRGYAFVTLDAALADPAYSMPENYVGRGGFSWIHRWSMTKGMPPKGEPEPPAWVVEAARTL